MFASRAQKKISAVLMLAGVVTLLASCRRTQTPPVDHAGAVKATNPLAYYRLNATSGRSETGGSEYKFVDGVTVADSGAPGTDNKSALLDGKTGWISTTQKGGIATASSIMAWVNLAKTTTETGRILYVAGESENGNDMDVQFENDELRFYTAGGSHAAYKFDPATLTNRWHMIVATFDTGAGTRALYWDGQQVASDNDPGKPTKISVFSIGASTVFGGRYFPGNIDEVALWNRSLSASEVAALYKGK